MESQFDKDTAVEQVDEFSFEGTISGAWNINTNPNGGYLAALALRAMLSVSNHGDPLAVTAHFLRPVTSGTQVSIDTERVRDGRRISTVRARIVQDGLARLEMVGSFGEFRATASPLLTVPVPEMPSPEECPPRSPDDQGVVLHLEDHIETRLASVDVQNPAETSGWIRFRDGRDPDLLALTLFADAFPPSVFRLSDKVGWIPTVELTVHFRAEPSAGWVRGNFLTDDFRDGTLVETGNLWDASGALVARSRQLALVLPRE